MVDNLRLHEKFIRWVKECITFLTLSVLLVWDANNSKKFNRNKRNIRLARSSPTIYHLHFADDLVVFTQLIESNVKNCKNVLDKFCSWSGKKKKTLAKEIQGMKRIEQDSKHLGNPIFISRKRSESYPFLVDNLQSKLVFVEISLPALNW